jgi:hypothetical protein
VQAPQRKQEMEMSFYKSYKQAQASAARRTTADMAYEVGYDFGRKMYFARVVL